MKKSELKQLIKEVIKETKTQVTKDAIKAHINKYSVDDDPFEVAKEIGKVYGWSQKQIENAEKIIRKYYIK